MRVQLEHKDTIRQSLQIVAYSVGCTGNTRSTTVWTRHRAPLYGQDMEHRCMDNTRSTAVWTTHGAPLYGQQTPHCCMDNTLNTWSKNLLHEKKKPKA